MLGFIVSLININEQVDKINQIISDKNYIFDENLSFREINKDFKHSYVSKHTVEGEKKVIYHLMLDFSEIVE